MITQVDLLIEMFDNLEGLLFEYNQLTGRLSSADTENTGETQAIIEQREKLIDRMKKVKPEITRLINSQTPDKAEAIRKMMAGETVMSDFSDDEKAVQVKVTNLLSIQTDIVKKDIDAQTRFKRKYDEIRGELEDLQKGKKRINFYQNAKTDEKGTSYDTQN